MLALTMLSPCLLLLQSVVGLLLSVSPPIAPKLETKSVFADIVWNMDPSHATCLLVLTMFTRSESSEFHLATYGQSPISFIQPFSTAAIGAGSLFIPQGTTAAGWAYRPVHHRCRKGDLPTRAPSSLALRPKAYLSKWLT